MVEPGGWRRGNLNNLVREKFFPSGMRREERVNPSLRSKRTYDTYPDSFREKYEWELLPEEDPLRGAQQSAMSLGQRGAALRFGNRGSQCVIAVDCLDQYHFTIKIVDDIKNAGPHGVHGLDYESLIVAKYNTRNLVELVLKAEVLEPIFATENHTDNPPIPDWRDNLSVFLGYLRNKDEDFLRESGLANSDKYKDVVDDMFSDVNNPKLNSANDTAQKLIETLLKYIPPDDQAEAGKFFAVFALKELFAANLLKKLKYGEVDSVSELPDFNIDEFLSTQLAFEIDFLADIDTFPQQLLILNQFTGKGYDWREIESEDFDEGEERGSGCIEYRERISIQGDEFTVRRIRDSIVVDCLVRKGRKRWQAILPLYLDSGRIDVIANDLDRDFREAEFLLKTHFRRPND